MSSLNISNDQIKESNISTIKNAAKISHLIHETTIGPLSSCTEKHELDESRINNDAKHSSDHWKRDVWRSVDLESEKRQNCGSALNLMDCKAIQLRMANQNAEKKRQKQVRLEMAQRQAQFNELDDMMKSLKIDLIEKSALKLQKNLLSKEEELLKIVQQLENHAQIAEERANKEIVEHNKKMFEKINRWPHVEEVRGYFQSIKSFKDLFIMLFERFVKTYLSHQQSLKNVEAYTQTREEFLRRYEHLFKVNSGHLSSVEVVELEKLCDEIKEMQLLVDEEIKNAEDLKQAIADRNEKLKEEQQQQQQQNRSLNVHNILPAISSLNRFVSNDRLNHYSTIMHFYEDYASSVKTLKADDNMRKFRFDCQKGVNILLNTICGVSPNNLQDRFDKLTLILSGKAVNVNGIQINTSKYPLGIRFANLVVADKFVKLADTITGSHRSAFPIASLIVAIWQKFPDFGKLFLAYLYKACPFLVPYFIPHAEGQSMKEYLKSVDFQFKDNVCEENAQFLKRLSGLVRLYSSVIISQSRRAINKPHPHGIENGLIWLTNISNLDSLPDGSATLIYEFLITVGNEMWRVYNKQFVKLLQLLLLQAHYMIQLDNSGGHEARLDGFLRKILTENKIDRPKYALPPNFW